MNNTDLALLLGTNPNLTYHVDRNRERRLFQRSRAEDPTLWGHDWRRVVAENTANAAQRRNDRRRDQVLNLVVEGMIPPKSFFGVRCGVRWGEVGWRGDEVG